jgi:phenylalanine-4-hydroxylase
MGELSEMAQIQPSLVDCGIWFDRTVEIQIYGAGLLSSIGESAFA